jgi:hypothetical protein
MYKLLTFAGYDSAGPHIFPIEADRERTVGHIKLARPLPPRVEQYIKTAKPVAGKTQLLIDALGAGEYWGDNANGDIFYEAALRHDGDDYGFRTFEKHAHPFMHHVNSDPKRAYGDRVTLSEYDPVMHRVLLIVSVHDDKCQQILRDLANQIYWAVSMGAKVPFDTCSICKNKARTRAEYCPHLRYQMRKILPDGRRVCAINDYPRFFDISFVTVGAEKAAHVLQKVAHAGAPPCEVRSSAEEGERVYGKLAAQLKASATKEADIDKVVPSNIPPSAETVRPIAPADEAKLVELARGAGALRAAEPPLPEKVLDRLADFPLNELASTLTALGIPLKPQEFQRIILVQVGQRPLAEKLARGRVVFDEHKVAAATPAWARPLERFEPAAVNEKIALLLQPYVAHRSAYPEPLLARLRQLDKHADATDRSPIIYNPLWYPRAANDDSAPPRPPSLAAFVPAALALAAGFLLLKQQFPQLAESGPLAIVRRHPWLLPILLSGGVGAAVGLHSLLTPRSMTDASSVDGMHGGPYDALSKSASMEVPWMRLGLVPMAYVGVRDVVKRAAAADFETELLNRMVRFGKRNQGETHAHAR